MTNFLRKPRVKIILISFVIITLVLYWNLIKWTTTTIMRSQDNNEFGYIQEDDVVDSNHVDNYFGGSQQVAIWNHNNCKKTWSNSVSRWLGARMDRNINVVWTEGNQRMNYKLVEWWMKQYGGGGDDDDHHHMVDVSAIFDGFYKAGVKRNDVFDEMRHVTSNCFTCAIVGDSGKLMGSSLGKVGKFFCLFFNLVYWFIFCVFRL